MPHLSNTDGDGPARGSVAMRILYASERPSYPFFLGGAARCTHQLLSKLSGELDVSCAAVGSEDYAVTLWSYPEESEYAALGVQGVDRNGRGTLVNCSYPVRILPEFRSAVQDLLSEFRPDILWTQLEGARWLLELARSRGIQSVYFVHDSETPPAELRSIADLGCRIVCSSRFVADKTQQIVGRRTHVVYPCPNVYFDTEGDPNGYLTMINPSRVKGLPTFIEVARCLPAEKFLLVESWKLTDAHFAELRQTLRQVPNVRLVRRVLDMRSIYAQTRLLLVPSIWEEGFGMVVVEAQSCRIPVVASARGGLPESVGDGGVLIQRYKDADAWVAVIQDLLGNRRNYDELAGRALRHAHAEEFTASCSARRFLEVCSGPVSRGSAYARGISALISGIARVPGLKALLRHWAR